MGRPFIRHLSRKEGDRFYACRFCRTPIASAPRISVAENGTISSRTFQLDFVNVYTPNPPKKWGRQTIQEFYCTYCNGRLGRKSIQVKKKPAGRNAEFIFGGGMQILRGIPVPAMLPFLIEIIDVREPHNGNIPIIPHYIVEDDNPPPSTDNIYICRNCYNQIALTDSLMDANFSIGLPDPPRSLSDAIYNFNFLPRGSGVAGGLFEEVVNVEGRELRDVDHFSIAHAHCKQCDEHLGWQFVEARAPPPCQLLIISGDYILIMDRLMILIVDDDDLPLQNQGQGGH